MTKITANSMKCASVGGCAHTAAVHIAGNDAVPEEEEARKTPPKARSDAAATKTKSE